MEERDAESNAEGEIRRKYCETSWWGEWGRKRGSVWFDGFYFGESEEKRFILYFAGYYVKIDDVLSNRVCANLFYYIVSGDELAQNSLQ